ncbi:UDP-glycosyltransferase 88F4 [Malus sylvestris]|uniref:UDP-glycosyltransferase 88F4 n=1 Tax=Malus sylvestris TaxID=3752 RepID=UPI0021ACCD9F|nr:UDP-glycosyltransferase 88F4 [Malus sylvestris]
MGDAIVLYAAPGTGHIVSMVELGKLIVHRYGPHKFSITILYTCGSVVDITSIPAYIRRISHSHPSISFRQFPRVTNKITRNISGAAIMFDFIRQNDPHVRRALQEISKSAAVRAFIIDLFCTSALPIGKEFNIPTYYFYTSGAAALAAFLYFPKIDEQTTESFKDLRDTVFEFPGWKSPLKAIHMVEPVLDRNDTAYSDMIYFCSQLPKSNGIIVNTFEELESSNVLQAIAGGLCVPDGPTPPVYYVGPLIDEEKELSNDAAAAEEEDCLSWLDKQPSRSVLFLCFGSRGSFPAAQLKEIANGLEASGQRFLWVVKKPPVEEKTKQVHGVDDFDLEGVLPEGFLERTADRGMVVKSWAPQVVVLKKESVGGFVTHCGWNSVLEAVVAGVPMIAWPLYAEQHMNRNVLVTDMEIAIGVEQRDEEDGFVSGEEVERRVRELMESGGRVLRERCKKIGEMALAALGETGSSSRNLVNFVSSIT